ncbi:glutamate receptor ionotropic, delta-1-like [Acyrthosiphon pisum]|uniref:Ionotropic glutamate receptor C-terminal domain-containing protein n=1 Tax=Acyrthosiphon pisum TaxID=7029 RepID=A0A8R2JU31_ACYPI|nr:glutamate receptor ionotropic, delta-1-like [Acyrthosiphon pisum]
MRNPMILLWLCLAASTFRTSVEYDGLINALTRVFVHKHVQTVTATTCWPTDANGRLLLALSSADISVNFRPSLIPVHKTWYKYGILVDVSCSVQIPTTLFRKASKHRLFNMQNDWILINSRRNESHVLNTSVIALETFEMHLSEAYVLPESNVFLFIDTPSGWEIWEGFKVGKMERIQVKRHGMVTSDGIYFEKNDSISFKSNLRGITLKATTVISEPSKFKGFYPFADTDLDTFAHMHYDLNMILQDQLNFKIDLGIVNSFGWDMGNASFSGLTGQLQREECDFSGIGVFIRNDRMTVIDYTVGTFYRQAAALFKQPPLSSVHNICILPFKFEVWMVTLFTFIGFTILIAFLSRMTRRLKKDEEETLNVLDSVTIVHGAICQQGYTMNLNAGSIRVAIFVLFLTAVFLFTSYSASIVALLQSPSNSIKTINDLVESSMTFSAQDNPYNDVYFGETDDPLLRKLYDKKMRPHGTQKFTLASAGIARIRTEFHGFMIDFVSAYKLISQLWLEEEKCGLSEIQLFKLPMLALAVVKRSGYKDILKQKLIHQQEVGLKNRIIRRWIPAKPMCDSSNRANQFVSVSIKEIYPMLQIYGFGLCISIVILFVEIVYNTYTDRSENLHSNTYFSIFRFMYNK